MAAGTYAKRHLEKKATFKYRTHCKITKTHSPNAPSYPTAERGPTNSINAHTGHWTKLVQISYHTQPCLLVTLSFLLQEPLRLPIVGVLSPHRFQSTKYTVRSHSQEHAHHTHRLYIATDITSCCPLGTGMLVTISPDLVLTGIESGITSSRAASRFIVLKIG